MMDLSQRPSSKTTGLHKLPMDRSRIGRAATVVKRVTLGSQAAERLKRSTMDLNQSWK
jgi:hypothetical protein